MAAWVEAIGTWFTGLITFVALLWAIFHERWLDWLNRPKLAVSIRPYAPDCMKLMLGRVVSRGDSVEVPDPFPVYYLRLRVKNLGRRCTEAVQVRLCRVEQLRGQGDCRQIRSLTNLNLTWSRRENGNNLVFLPNLPRGAFEHCNLAHVFKPADRQTQDVAFLFEKQKWADVSPDQTILSLDIVDRPFHLPHLLPPGSYRFHIAVSSADAEPITSVVTLRLSGEWYADEGEMFEKGILLG